MVREALESEEIVAANIDSFWQNLDCEGKKTIKSPNRLDIPCAKERSL